MYFTSPITIFRLAETRFAKSLSAQKENGIKKQGRPNTYAKNLFRNMTQDECIGNKCEESEENGGSHIQARTKDTLFQHVARLVCHFACSSWRQSCPESHWIVMGLLFLKA